MEPTTYNGLKVGDSVLNMGKRSKFYGDIGVITELGFSVIVKYDHTHVLGRHPADILIKMNRQHFEDDLFEL